MVADERSESRRSINASLRCPSSDRRRDCHRPAHYCRLAAVVCGGGAPLPPFGPPSPPPFPSPPAPGPFAALPFPPFLPSPAVCFGPLTPHPQPLFSPVSSLP